MASGGMSCRVPPRGRRPACPISSLDVVNGCRIRSACSHHPQPTSPFTHARATRQAPAKVLVAMAARTSARRAATRREPVSLIIDTDLSIDVDDVGALCAAHALADLGKVDLLAVVHDTGFDAGIAA
eukprot:3328259-Prymnesium_polylepis.1